MKSNLYTNLLMADFKDVLKKDKLMLVDITEDLIKNTRKLGIEIFTADLSPQGVSGLLNFNSRGVPVIYLNESDSLERKRFTLAHELGHLYMHAKWNLDSTNADYNYEDVLYTRNMERSNREREANCFAADLLMPKGNFTDIFNVYEGDISKMADYFNVSREAVKNRIDNLNLAYG